MPPDAPPPFPNADFEVIEEYAYDGRGGRVSERVIYRFGLPQFVQGFTWTELGNLDQLSYPDCAPGAPCGGSGAPVRAVAHTYDAGFLTAIPGYAGSIGYHPNEMLDSVAHANGVTDEWGADPNGMRRPAHIRTQGVAFGPESEFDTGTYAYDGAGNITGIGADAFFYDHVSRLRDAWVDIRGYPHTQSQRYDPFGNRLDVGGTAGARDLATDPWTNRLLGSPEVPVGYDPTGNLTSRGQMSYTYDDFHMLLRLEAPNASPGLVDQAYIYTADDERIAIADFVTVTNYWTLRDLDGQVIRQLTEDSAGNWKWTRDTIRRDGQLLATAAPDLPGSGLEHYHVDHLGTPRLRTGGDASVVVRHDLLPFGEEAPAPGVPADEQPFLFTGHERDTNGVTAALCGDPPAPCQDFDTVDGLLTGTERYAAGVELEAGPNVTVATGADITFRAGERVVISGEFAVEAGATWVAENASELGGVPVELDYMHARYCSPVLGRFLSVDPVDSAEPIVPQSWNKYGYAANNPLKFTDSNGEAVNFIAGAGGALIGGIFGGVGSAVVQLATGTSVSDLNFQNIGAAVAGGAVSGGLAGLTLGTSLVAQGGVGAAIAATAGANVVGGGVERALDSSAETQVLDTRAAAVDLGAGVVAGAGGALVEGAVKRPLPGLQRQIEGMQAAARGGGRGAFGAARGAQGLQRQAQTIRTTADVLSNVTGAKVTGVGGAVVKQKLEEVLPPPE